MAIFGSKKNTKKAAAPKETKEVAVAKTVETAPSLKDLSRVIVRPRITEKAGVLSEKNVYSFEIAEDANKIAVAEAIKELYNVTPAKIAVVRIPAKKVFVRGKWGVRKGGKKAYVYLKKGETIEFV